MQRDQILLAAGIAVPFIYFANLVIGGLLTPGFSHVTQMPSELGVAAAPYAALFNAGLIAVALTTFMGAAGLFFGLRSLGVGMFLTLLTSVSLALSAVSIGMSGLFPLPDPLHYGFGLVLAGVFTPLFGALALSAVKDAGTVRLILLLGFGASIAVVAAIFATNFGVMKLVDQSTAGLWVRGYALTGIPSVAVLCWAVMRGIPN
ncbi:MAG: DUF998 domain-containing protein [Micropepsaceae bacterium]